MKKKKKKLYCAFIDFAKAFDTVSVIQFSPKEFLLCKKSSKSFKYKENKKGDKFSPCLTQ
jgi:hypothetical protein